MKTIPLLLTIFLFSSCVPQATPKPDVIAPVPSPKTQPIPAPRTVLVQKLYFDENELVVENFDGEKLIIIFSGENLFTDSEYCRLDQTEIVCIFDNPKISAKIKISGQNIFGVYDLIKNGKDFFNPLPKE